MAVSIGTRIGPYEITATLGEGGMGVVYRARDTKLGRDVAIKTLPEEFARDSDRLSRFEREAKVLASLNHRNIAGIHGLEDYQGTPLLVLEVVEGDTLADRIRRGPVPVDEALGMARQIAESLEAAHERGVVHRDLKPANIKITPEGQVKILDFGLAKAFAVEAADANLSNSPTLSMAATQAGVILGTASYMSPEQARGRTVDERTDIFAFGCVLFEMLTGKRAFDGEDVTEIIGAIVRAEPDWNALPAGVPLRVHELLRLCLEKNVRNRRANATDVRLDLEAALREPAPSTVPAISSRGSRLAWIAAAVALLAAVLLAVPAARHFREISPREMRLEIMTPSTSFPLDLALSPDGRYIVFPAAGGGASRLWLRALDKTDAQPMAGTENAQQPFWSPDSRSIGFYSDGKLKRIDIAGGPPQVLAIAASARGGTWNADGTILFSGSTAGPLSRISAFGGTPVEVTRLDPPRHTAHRFPQFLPDGNQFLFYAQGIPESSGIYLGSLEGGDPKRILNADTAGAYWPPGFVLFVRQTALMVQALDVTRGEVTGEPAVIADPVGWIINAGGFSVSAAGLLAYRSGSGGRTQLTWVDRAGRDAGVASDPDTSTLTSPQLSPDGNRVVLRRTVAGNNDVWILDVARKGMTRFTFDPAQDNYPVWSSDGTRIAFVSNRDGQYDLFVKPSSGAGAEEVLLRTSGGKVPLDWSSDGSFLLYNEASPTTGRDLWALPMTGTERQPIALVYTPFEEDVGEFSPDGRWLAYQTNESGRFEIMVQPFPETTGKWQVSTNGGTQPRWRADGKELYFVGPDGTMMASSITMADSTFISGTPVALFPAGLAPQPGVNQHQYTVSRDGRFLLNRLVDSSAGTPITVVLNWKPAQ